MRPIRVCHLTTVHPPFDVRIFHKEAKSLLNAGYDVSLIAQHDKDEMVDGVKVIALPRISNRLYRISILTLRAFWIALKEDAAIYHFHDPELIPASLLLKLISGKKLIYDVHEDYGKQILSKSYLPKRARKKVAYLIKKIEHYSSYFINAVVCATDDISYNYSHRKNVISVKNFPAMSVSNEVACKIKKSHALNLIYAGGISLTRGINEIVRSLEYINNSEVKLTVCGKFSSKDLESSVRMLKGFEKVNYLGWHAHEEMAALMGSHDVGIVCLHPTINYLRALPIKLFEYMACGLPVIASNFPMWKKIVEGNECGICVDPLEPEDIARAIIYLMEHPDEARQMGINGRNAVERKYNWEEEKRKLISIYEELAAQR